jgi:hypothetical protein
MSLCPPFLPPAKRIRTVDAAGVEELHEQNKWVHLDLKQGAAQDAEAAEAAQGPQDAARQEAAGDPEEAPDRMKPFESLYAARVRRPLSRRRSSAVPQAALPGARCHPLPWGS